MPLKNITSTSNSTFNKLDQSTHSTNKPGNLKIINTVKKDNLSLYDDFFTLDIVDPKHRNLVMIHGDSEVLISEPKNDSEGYANFIMATDKVDLRTNSSYPYGSTHNFILGGLKQELKSNGDVGKNWIGNNSIISNKLTINSFLAYSNLVVYNSFYGIKGNAEDSNPQKKGIVYYTVGCGTAHEISSSRGGLFVGYSLRGGGGTTTILGASNEDVHLNETTTTTVSATYDNPKFIIGNGNITTTGYNGEPGAGTRSNAFEVWNDGLIKAPSTTLDLYDKFNTETVLTLNANTGSFANTDSLTIATNINVAKAEKVIFNITVSNPVGKIYFDFPGFRLGKEKHIGTHNYVHGTHDVVATSLNGNVRDLTFKSDNANETATITINSVTTVNQSKYYLTTKEYVDNAAMSSGKFVDDGTVANAIKYTTGNVGIGGDAHATHKLLITGDGAATGDFLVSVSSDERLKDNIVKISDPLGKLSQLNGYEFDWNDKQVARQGHDIGVIAQEVEKVLPEVVTTRDNGYKAVAYDRMVALLIETNKELLKRIEVLEEKLK